jgi:hypothetical protein
MEDSDRVRDALRAYMAANHLNPTRWSLESGLSERAIAHFLAGRSKSMTPSSLGKLAQSRGTTIRGLLGFLPRFAEQPLPLGEEPAAGMALLAEALGRMTDEIRHLRQKVDSLEAALRKQDDP